MAVCPGKPDSIHPADLPKPKVEGVPGGRGVLVEVLRAGAAGTDKEIRVSSLWRGGQRLHTVRSGKQREMMQ